MKPNIDPALLADKKHRHPQFGYGENMEMDFHLHIKAESECAACIHRAVCSREKVAMCANFKRGNSDGNGCSACVHRYARYSNEKVPCFICPHFEREGKKKMIEPLGMELHFRASCIGGIEKMALLCECAAQSMKNGASGGALLDGKHKEVGSWELKGGNAAECESKK